MLTVSPFSSSPSPSESEQEYRKIILNRVSPINWCSSKLERRSSISQLLKEMSPLSLPYFLDIIFPKVNIIDWWQWESGSDSSDNFSDPFAVQGFEDQLKPTPIRGNEKDGVGRENERWKKKEKQRSLGKGQKAVPWQTKIGNLSACDRETGTKQRWKKIIDAFT